jgi:hypothetical protein
MDQKDIKIFVSKNKSDLKDKHSSEVNLMKRSIHFPTNFKNDSKEKIDSFLERNMKKLSSKEIYEKIKPTYKNSNSNERKTINLKKSMFVNEQPKLSNVFMNGKKMD